MLRMEIACILILLFIAAIYFNASREKNAIHKIFSAILITLMIHLVFDAITVVTVSKLDTFPRFWNDTFHRFFLSTMLFTIYLYYRYICALIEQETGEESTTKLYMIVSRLLNIYLVIAEILLFVTPVSYAVTPKGNYETGVGAVIMYVSIALFLVHMIYNMSVHWKQIHPKKRYVIVAAFVIEIIVTVLTAIDTSLLLAGMGLTMIAVSFYLVLENPDIKLLELARDEKRKADEANAYKSAFLSVVSHEIRTPMNVIVNMTEFLMREEHSEQADKYLKSIKTSGDSLLMIVNDLLDQSKIEAGKMEIIEDVYEWEPLLEEVRMIIENRIDTKPIIVKINLDEKLPDKIIGDRLRIRQILINLMNNAVKFTKRGSITLSIDVENQNENGMWIRYSVKDTGQGIRKEDMNMLFKAFAQVDSNKNYGKEGTGLGLTISKGFIKLMGGELRVQSEYGKGSEFYFTIYQHRASVDSESMDQKNRAIETNKLIANRARILVVDDTSFNLKIMKLLLDETGIHIDTATSGDEALELVKENTYDIIFMDYNMPYMDGAETTRMIRGYADEENDADKSLYYSDVPIIALTGDTLEESKDVFISSGMNDFVEKPVSKIMLFKNIAEMVAKGAYR